MPSRYRKFRVRRFLLVIFFSSLTFFLWLNHVTFTALQTKWGELATAQPPNASQLVQQGIEQYRVGNLQGAIASWQTALTAYQNTNNHDNAAIVREKLAIAYQQLGQFEEAINYWKEVIANYRSSEELVKVGQLLTELAQTYSRLGQNKEAIALLCGASETGEDCLKTEGSALQIAQKFSDRHGEVAALGSLGEAYRLKGKYDLAIETLDYSLKIAQENNLSVYRSSVFNSLGNAYFGKAQLNEQHIYSAKLRSAETKTDEFIKEATYDYKKALGYFNNSLELTRFSNDLSSQMRTLLNLIQLYRKFKGLRPLHLYVAPVSVGV